jgi:hypothetical protein
MAADQIIYRNFITFNIEEIKLQFQLLDFYIFLHKNFAREVKRDFYVPEEPNMRGLDRACEVIV